MNIANIIASMPLSPLALEEMNEEERAAYFSEGADRQREAINRAGVFGHDHRTDANGRAIEQGIGSAANPSENHFKALLIAERRGDEAPGTTERLRAEAEKRKKVAR